jgi:hypothetical protein
MARRTRARTPARAPRSVALRRTLLTSARTTTPNGVPFAAVREGPFLSGQPALSVGCADYRLLVSKTYDQEFDALRDIYLEDSWVLGVDLTDGGLLFDLDAVLTPEHPAFRGARPDEQYDYRRSRMIVSGNDMTYEPSQSPGFRDASGELDYGNIDSFTMTVDGAWLLEGHWGRASVREPRVQLDLNDG